jgi:hypothetical protein
MTTTATETKSIGLPANPAFGEGRRAGALPACRQVGRPTLTRTATQLTRRAVMFKQLVPSPMPRLIRHDDKISLI